MPLLQRPDCFVCLPADFPPDGWPLALSWFFGPSLLPCFHGSLHYYGLC
ncbi:MAG: hypothetical protein ACKOLA_10670 [Spartobacteria bacterium]